MRKRVIIATVISVLTFATFANGCGKNADMDKPSTDATMPVMAEVENITENAPATAADAVGEWEFVYINDHSEYGDGTSWDYFTMASDDEGIDVDLAIRENGDGYALDFRCDRYESSIKMYGATLTYKEEAAYEKSANDKWCFEVIEPFTEDDKSSRKITLTDDGMLILYEFYTYTDSENPEYNSFYVSEYRFVRKGDERLNDLEQFRYFDTVTVSNVVELVNSLKSNSCIEVEAGTYDFSRVSSSQIDNARVQLMYEELVVSDVHDIKIKAKDGADVLFCVDSPTAAVLTFENDRKLTLEGITAGHNVEPGFCSGSVLKFSNCSGLNIDKCNLYGSGTYGIDATNSYDINVTDSEIYECTYGLLNLYDIGTARFSRCTMRDSKEYSMINIYSAYDVTFEDCIFANNEVAYDYCYFVELGDYDSANFLNCTFKNNKFYTFANKAVNMEKCKDENNSAGFKDAMNDSGVLDATAIKKEYDNAVERQKEIDTELNGSLMDQQSLNDLSYESYTIWDNLLNRLWSYLGSTLDEATFSKLGEEELTWIKEKEAKMKSDGEQVSSGSIQPMVEYGSGATITRSRVEELMNKYM